MHLPIHWKSEARVAPNELPAAYTSNNNCIAQWVVSHKSLMWWRAEGMLRRAKSVKSAIEPLAGRRRTLSTGLYARSVLFGLRALDARERERKRCYRRDRIMNCCWGCKWGALSQISHLASSGCVRVILLCSMRPGRNKHISKRQQLSYGVGARERRRLQARNCRWPLTRPRGACPAHLCDLYTACVWLIARAPFYRCTCSYFLFTRQSEMSALLLLLLGM